MIEAYIWPISFAALAFSLLILSFFWRVADEEQRLSQTFRVVPHEETEWGTYFVVVNGFGDIVAGPTFYQRMVERCAALNAKAPSR